MKSRRERRAEARESKTAFEPQYKGRVITKAQYDTEIEQLKEEREKASQVVKKVQEETTIKEATE